MRIGFIGGGRMCRSFCKYLALFPIEIADILTKQTLYTDFDRRCINCETLTAFLHKCDIVFLTVPDDAITPLAEDISRSGADFDGCVFCHMSGSLTDDALLPLRCQTGTFSLHTMTSLTGGFVDFSKVICTLQGSGVGKDTVLKFARLSKLNIIDIKKENKLLYHAASCLCANFFLPLLDAAKRIYLDIGFSSQDADALMFPLLSQAMENIVQNGFESALTGPFSRGDCSTIQKHICALELEAPDYAPLYRYMGQLTAAFAEKNGYLSAKQREKISEILK